MNGILRVFPRRTTHTPTDDLAVIGEPGLFPPPDFSKIHVSCAFTWDLEESMRLFRAWGRRHPRVPIALGGPATGSGDGEFVPGLYVKKGISVSSRGCPGNCPWCLVPKREGKLRLLDICPGHIIQDNNVLAFPKWHFRKLIQMLRGQRQAKFAGGLEAGRLTDWHVEQLRRISIREVWFAADTDAALPALRKALDKLKHLKRREKRCYVLAGFNGESMEKAETRLEAVWDAGAVPFVQLYRDEADSIKYDAKWRAFRRKWCRMRAVVSAHGGE